MPGTPTVEIDPDTLVEIFDDEAVLVSLRTEQYHALDASGTRFWLAVVEHRDPAEVVRRLVADTGADEERVAAELDRFVRALLERGLVREVA